MKLFALATAATIALATSASAMAPTQLEVGAQIVLDKYGFNVDAGDLSTFQRLELNRLDDNTERHNFGARERIVAILGR